MFWWNLYMLIIFREFKLQSAVLNKSGQIRNAFYRLQVTLQAETFSFYRCVYSKSPFILGSCATSAPVHSLFNVQLHPRNNRAGNCLVSCWELLVLPSIHSYQAATYLKQQARRILLKLMMSCYVLHVRNRHMWIVY